MQVLKAQQNTATLIVLNHSQYQMAILSVLSSEQNIQCLSQDQDTVMYLLYAISSVLVLIYAFF